MVVRSLYSSSFGAFCKDALNDDLTKEKKNITHTTRNFVECLLRSHGDLSTSGKKG